MNERPAPEEFDLDPIQWQQELAGLLRFVVCGSVDHGKSTLIGRLLYDARQLFEDQLDALKEDSRRFGTQGGGIDFSLLVDGLAAEREQKITIDVAYRFFATGRRRFIVIDAPGHEQYTANMASGASLADLALVLVSADAGITRQTRRHLLILSTLGVRRIMLVVNKMDLVGWSQESFGTIEAEFTASAEELGVTDIQCIPVAAKSGDNVVAPSPHMQWYVGPTLIEYLDQVEIGEAHQQPFRMPIQWVNRPSPEFRGYSGLVTSGEIMVGMPVRILPSGCVSRVARIVTYDGDLDRAPVGRSVTLALADQIDASRGDLIVAIDDPPSISEQISARVFWMGGRPLTPGQNYLLKLATTTASATVEPGLSVIDLDTGPPLPAASLAQNETGTCTLTLDRPIAVDRYAENRRTGSFILIDPESYDTVGMGCVKAADAKEGKRGRWFAKWRSRSRGTAAMNPVRMPTESRVRSLAKAVSWRTTGSVDTFIVTFAITGSSKFAGSVAITEIVTKILIYYFHERVWAWVPWGKRRVDA